ncbi:hypothetical protein HCO18_004374 [Salmonella enterica]|nr:hypothetical protein [Salmonella enterica subsp. enterica serovar Javiana]EEP9293693.1 hypothetical protein [Salmonella enterica]EGX7302458.1 hypothetical protein [Salmonella enterica]EGX8329226.1 hypothetical protein [Salmonella enterica subsp. enterica serovar Javiana]
MSTRQHDIASGNKEDCGFCPERANVSIDEKNPSLYEGSLPAWILIFLLLASVFISGFLTGVLAMLWFISNSI